MKDELVKRLRAQLQLHGECTDKELLDAFEGSFTLEITKLSIAIDELKAEFKVAFKKDFPFLYKLMRGKS